MAGMPHDDTPAADDAPALIAHIVERFHETHRRELPALLALAGEAGASAAALAEHLASMAGALELHMFKEEMRLFPMMEQGGSTLIGLLIDDLAREHRAHDEAIARLEALAGALPATAGVLRAGVTRFVADLGEHMRLEDEVLFPRYAASPRGSAVRP